MAQIWTRNGIIESGKAFALFEAHTEPTSVLLSVFEQLELRDQSCALEVAQFVNSNPVYFARPVQKLARKICLQQSTQPGPTRVTEWPLGLEKDDIHILETRTEVCYDLSLFTQLCVEFGHKNQIDQWSSKIPNPNTATMTQVLSVLPFMMRSQFLRRYVCCFDEAFAA